MKDHYVITAVIPRIPKRKPLPKEVKGPAMPPYVPLEPETFIVENEYEEEEVTVRQGWMRAPPNARKKPIALSDDEYIDEETFTVKKGAKEQIIRVRNV